MTEIGEQHYEIDNFIIMEKISELQKVIGNLENDLTQR